MFTIWNQVPNARISSAAWSGDAAVRPHDQLHGRIGVAVTTADRHLAVAFHLLEKGIATLVPQHFAHEAAERVDVLAERRILSRERNVFACHGREGRKTWVRSGARRAW